MALLLFVFFLVLGIVVSHWFFIGAIAAIALMLFANSVSYNEGVRYYPSKRRRKRRGG